MFIHAIDHYLPEQIVPNDHFTVLNGLSEEWIISRTGIHQRRKAAQDENTQTMGIKAAKSAISRAQFEEKEIDLIVGATYTPFDTIFTLAHAIQHELNIDSIPAVTISAACSSLVNAMEIVEGYFATQKASKALIVASEQNSAYYNEMDKVAGHLWGDGAVAIVITRERQSEQDLEILDIVSAGAATVGKAPEGVILQPTAKGFVMPHGRDVFIHACEYMASVTQDILNRNSLGLEQVKYFIPHQANLRITKHVAKELGLEEDRVISNLQYLGNTGCAGCGIALSEHREELVDNDHIIITVFGGGYSYGSALIRR